MLYLLAKTNPMEVLIYGGGAAIGGLLLLFLIVVIRSYRKTSSDKAFVRTGMGRAKVVVDGGTTVFPIIHQIKWISLETMRLTVDRRGRDALITNDRYRVDITCDFYVRVEADENKILRASRSLGAFSMTSESVMDLIGAKLIGALRSVAAQRTLLNLHEDREAFGDAVQEALKEDLTKNGLDLESVSTVNLDQTDMASYDENNVFDAEGLKKIVEETASRRVKKNQIEQEARVKIKQQDVTAAVTIKEQDVAGRKQQLALEQEEQIAVALQDKEVQTYTAAQERATIEFKLEQKENVEKRQIAKGQAVKEAEISTALKLEQDQIAMSQKVQEAQIATDLKIQTDTIDKEKRVEQASLERQTYIVEKQREREEAEIAKQTYLVDKQRQREEAEVMKELAIERANRDKQIGIIEKDRERELVETERLKVTAEREQAEQNVYLVEQTAEAEREKAVAIIAQRAEAETDLLAKQIAADAAAYELKKGAEAELEAAELRARAKERLATAFLADAEARAEGERKLIEAKNSTTQEVLVQQAVLAMIEKAPELMREAMKPAEKISDIRVINMSGFQGGGTGSEAGGTSSKIVQAIMEAGAALPMFKELLKAANIDSDMSLTDLARTAATAHPAVKRLLEKIPEELRAPSEGTSEEV